MRPCRVGEMKQTIYRVFGDDSMYVYVWHYGCSHKNAVCSWLFYIFEVCRTLIMSFQRWSALHAKNWQWNMILIFPFSISYYNASACITWFSKFYCPHFILFFNYNILDSNYICAHCQSQFVEKKSFDIHLKHSQACRDANPQEFRCGKCGEVFTTLINLQEHIRRHEQNDNPTSTCSISNKVSDSSTSQPPTPTEGSSQQDAIPHILIPLSGSLSSQEVNYFLKSHILSDSKHLQCKYCGDCFMQSADVQRHREVYHVGLSNESECSSEKVAEQSSVESSVKTSASKKPLTCQYCSKKFQRKLHLKLHLMIHTGEKPFKCEHCSKSFSHPTSLRHHLTSHTGEKPYQCHHCGASYVHSSSLRIHMRSHTGEKPYQCQHCSKTFTRSSGLFYHLRIHTGDKPYQCQQCSKSFQTKSKLNVHMQVHTKPEKCRKSVSESKDWLWTVIYLLL